MLQNDVRAFVFSLEGLYKMTRVAVDHGLLKAGEGVIDAGHGIGLFLIFIMYFLNTTNIFGFEQDKVRRHQWKDLFLRPAKRSTPVPFRL